MVSVNSDSDELQRHLNLEAAKSMRYGGLNETEALAMVTINPAKQLGIDDRVGSIEVGKSADLVLFDGYPLWNYSKHCEFGSMDMNTSIVTRIWRRAPNSNGRRGRLKIRTAASHACPHDDDPILFADSFRLSVVRGGAGCRL